MTLMGITHHTLPVICSPSGHLLGVSETRKGEEPSFPFQCPPFAERVLLEDPICF